MTRASQEEKSRCKTSPDNPIKKEESTTSYGGDQRVESEEKRSAQKHRTIC